MAVALAAFGCAVGELDAPESERADAPPGESQEALWRAGWGPSEWAVYTVGMAKSPERRTYAWYDDGWVCRSDIGERYDVCNDAMYQYTAPGADFAKIRGIGIARDTARVFAWYEDSTYTRGTSDDLTRYHGKHGFTRPAKPGGGTFAMSQLVEVDNSPNGRWYFYWKSGSTVYRTVGTSADGEAYSPATPVNVAGDHGRIVGIGFDEYLSCSPGFENCVTRTPINVWYEDGFFNESHTSLDLAQP